MPSPLVPWRRMPPAVFPPILGIFGLGLAWRSAGVLWPLVAPVADAILGAATLLLLAVLLPYLAKLAARPAVLAEEFRVVPARAAVAAASMAVMGLSLAVAPHAPALAKTLLVVSLGFQAIVAAVLLWVLLRLPPEAPKWGPGLHLAFVGTILAAIGAGQIGWTELSRLLFWQSLLSSAVIYAGTVPSALRGGVPAPLRPPLAIHLSPLSLFGTEALLLGDASAARLFFGLAVVVFLFLLARIRWLVQAGFSPLWGSFTFPLAAFAGLCLNLQASGQSAYAGLLGAAVLLVASAVIPWIATRVLQSWLRGQLAPATNAATA